MPPNVDQAQAVRHLLCVKEPENSYGSGYHNIIKAKIKWQPFCNIFRGIFLKFLSQGLIDK